ncbi:MAG: hypothetical protein AAFX52_13110 [Pseudomonadota bacterium]
MKIVDPQNSPSWVAAKGAVALRNAVLVLLLLLVITSGAFAAFGGPAQSKGTLNHKAGGQLRPSSAAVYGSLDPLAKDAHHYPTEGVDAFRQRSEEQVRDYYEELEEGLYQRIIEAGLDGKGGPFLGEDGLGQGMGGAEDNPVRMIQASFGGSVGGSFSGMTTMPLENGALDPIFDPARTASMVPFGHLPQVVFPALSGSGAYVPTLVLADDDMIGEVPVPGAVLLFPAGLAFLINARQRRKR